MSNAVAKLPEQRSLAEAPHQEQPAKSVNGAVSEIMSGLQQAVSAMDCDDLSVELSAHSENGKSSAHFRMRAYRNGRTVVSKDG